MLSTDFIEQDRTVEGCSRFGQIVIDVFPSAKTEAQSFT